MFPGSPFVCPFHHIRWASNSKGFSQSSTKIPLFIINCCDSFMISDLCRLDSAMHYSHLYNVICIGSTIRVNSSEIISSFLYLYTFTHTAYTYADVYVYWIWDFAMVIFENCSFKLALLPDRLDFVVELRGRPDLIRWMRLLRNVIQETGGKYSLADLIKIV